MLVSLGAWGRGQHDLPHSLLCSLLPNPYIGFFLETPRLPWVPVLLGICLFHGGGEACAGPGSSMGLEVRGQPTEVGCLLPSMGLLWVVLNCKFCCPLGFSLLVSSPSPSQLNTALRSILVSRPSAQASHECREVFSKPLLQGGVLPAGCPEWGWYREVGRRGKSGVLPLDTLPTGEGELVIEMQCKKEGRWGQGPHPCCYGRKGVALIRGHGGETRRWGCSVAYPALSDP